MRGKQFTVNSRKYDGSLRRSWAAYLLDRTDCGILLEGFFDAEITHPDLGIIAKGTRSVEAFPFDRWFNCFVFYQPSGAFRNYYINVSMPPIFGDNLVDYVDLDIDVIIWPDGSLEVLDLVEFEENSIAYGYPLSVVDVALNTKDGLVRDPSLHLNPLFSSVELPT